MASGGVRLKRPIGAKQEEPERHWKTWTILSSCTNKKLKKQKSRSLSGDTVWYVFSLLFVEVSG